MNDEQENSSADKACDLFARLFEESKAIGRKPNGGTDRMALTQDDCAQRRWLVKLLESQGASVRVDGAGNIFGLRTWRDGAPYLLVGSHLDSQENGGVYDGAYGVVAAVAIAETIAGLVEQGAVSPCINLAVVDWTNEEGARFEPSLMGSRFYNGQLAFSDIEGSRDLQGTTFGSALANSGWLGRDTAPEAAAYLETHVEQASELKDHGANIGAVMGNWSAVKLDVRIDGEQSHTGSTPMRARCDALLGLALLTVAVHGIADEFPVELRTSVTKVQLFPHSPNIVTSKALAHVELRADALEDARNAKIALDERIAGIEEDASVKITITNIEQRSPMSFPENGIRAIEAAAARAGRSTLRLKTVCGHDAVALAGSIPTALLFVPSEGCMAHSPDEYTSPGDLAGGVSTLLELAIAVLEKGAF